MRAVQNCQGCRKPCSAYSQTRSVSLGLYRAYLNVAFRRLVDDARGVVMTPVMTLHDVFCHICTLTWNTGYADIKGRGHSLRIQPISICEHHSTSSEIRCGYKFAGLFFNYQRILWYGYCLCVCCATQRNIFVTNGATWLGGMRGICSPLYCNYIIIIN